MEAPSHDHLGLGAVARMMNEVSVDTVPARRASITARKWLSRSVA